MFDFQTPSFLAPDARLGHWWVPSDGDSDELSSGGLPERREKGILTSQKQIRAFSADLTTTSFSPQQTTLPSPRNPYAGGNRSECIPRYTCLPIRVGAPITSNRYC